MKGPGEEKGVLPIQYNNTYQLYIKRERPNKTQVQSQHSEVWIPTKPHTHRNIFKEKLYTQNFLKIRESDACVLTVDWCSETLLYLRPGWE